MTDKKKSDPTFDLPAGAIYTPADDDEVPTLAAEEMDDYGLDPASSESMLAGAAALTPRTRPIAWLVLHHLGGHTGQIQDRDDLLRISRGERFADIPYGAYVRPDGTLIPGRDVRFIGAAQLGINAIADSICLGGNFDGDDNPDGRRGWPLEPTDAQIETAATWLRGRLKAHPGAKFIQHCDVARITGNPAVATACPGSRAREGKVARIIFLRAGGVPLADARRRALAGK